MATERFNRQFVLLDFEDLDNPEFMAFVRSPEFSTYLIMRRYVWRSDTPHRLGLHEYYAQGLLASAVNREKIAEALGGVTPRQVTRDINSLVERGIVRSVTTGRGNVFILGKWGRDAEEKVYYEYFFADKLGVRLDKNVYPDWTSQIESGHFCPGSLDKNVYPDWTNLSSINRESNTETNREFSNLSNIPSPSPSSSNPSSEEESKEMEVLESSALEMLITNCSRDFEDTQHLESNLTRVFNLWAKTKLDEAGILQKAREAREITQRRAKTRGIREPGKAMAYFFAVLEDLLGMKKAPGKAFNC